MGEKFGLSSKTIQKINSVFAKYPQVREVLVYGSRSKGTYRPSSDIDLTMLGTDLDTTLLLKIENDLDDLLLPYQIDLSIYTQIENPDVVEHIKEYGQVFYDS